MPKDLVVWLRETNPDSTNQMAELADDYVTVRKGVMSREDWQRPKPGDRGDNPTGYHPDGQTESKFDKANSEFQTKFQIVILKQYRAEILRIAHDIPMAGHLGIDKTQQRILQNFF